jgi:hypothetical protein
MGGETHGGCRDSRAWYSFVLSVAGNLLIRGLSASINSEHYLIELMCGLAAVFVAGTFAAALSGTRSFPVSLSASIPSVAMAAFFVVLLGKEGSLNVQLWQPGSIVALIGWPVLSIAASYSAGVLVHRIAGEEPGVGPLRFLGIPGAHWYWLWLPMGHWACLIVCSIYLGWLSLATAWYWTFHPSLWFTRWFGEGLLGTGSVVLGIELLLNGIQRGMQYHAGGAHHGSKGGGALTLRFVWHGVLLAIVGSGLCMRVAFLSFSDLLSDISGTSTLWWVL